MEKQPYLPIKFYPVKAWQEWEKLKKYSDDKVIVKEYNSVPPAFQMVFPDLGRHWSEDSFILGAFDLVNYDDGTTYDMNSASIAQDPIVHRSDEGFRTMVWRRFPTLAWTFDEGLYYYHLIEVEGETEWFSEVFQLCNLKLDALVYDGGAGFDNESGFATFASGYVLANRMASVEFDKTGVAAPAYAYIQTTAFLGEEFDLYVNAWERIGGSGTDWDHPVFFFLKTTDGVVVSDIYRVDTQDAVYHFRLKAQAGGDLQLWMYINDADATEGRMWVALYRTYVEDHIQLRWSNDTNFCKIVYEELPELTPFLYENIYFINAQQVIGENSINENVVEDDAANKYPIIGTAQKWNSVQLVGSECMLNAMSLLRLHSNIQIVRELGEPMDIAELTIEQSVIDYHAALVNLVYREESCSENNCGFDICCPTENYPTLVTVVNGAGSLPAAASYPNRYAIAVVGARDWQVHLSNGAAWNVDTVLRVVGACIQVQNHFGTDFSGDYSAAGMTFSFFHTANTSTNWYPAVEITSVVDATGGQATVTIYAEYWYGANVWCQVEYYTGSEWKISLPFYIDQESWTAVPEMENLSAQSGARALTATCGAGTYYFRVHIWDGNCDLGYSLPVLQTIT
jgi:hypothetical protein